MRMLLFSLAAFLAVMSGAACEKDNSGEDSRQQETQETGEATVETPMTGKVNLWERGNIPTTTRNASNWRRRSMLGQ